MPLKSNNHKSIRKFKKWRNQKKRKITYHLLHFPDLPKKHAGVGLARKIGMDEAVDRFEQAEKPDGIIICLDADSQVEKDYFVEIERFFRMNLNTEACSIFYAHPLSGEEFPSEIYEGILRYELFLRYYVRGLRFADHPHAYHCVGSSMAVRSNAYQKRGGMNRRKAGEDFYFLQKFIQEGTLKELSSTTVIPSPRPSEKVPFGTGRAINTWLNSDQKIYPVYSPQTFLDLREFVRQIPDLYKADYQPQYPDSVHAFLEQESFDEKLAEVRANVTSKKAFIKRLFGWFDGLKVLKYVHFARDHFYDNVDVLDAAGKLLWMAARPVKSNSAVELLEIYREWDRNGDLSSF